MGSVTSYARAKAESLGMQAKGGIAERSDRLVAVLVMTGLSDIFDAQILLTLVLWVLAVATTITVVQRMVLVRRQAVSAPASIGLTATVDGRRPGTASSTTRSRCRLGDHPARP